MGKNNLEKRKKIKKRRENRDQKGKEKINIKWGKKNLEKEKQRDQEMREEKKNKKKR